MLDLILPRRRAVYDENAWTGGWSMLGSGKKTSAGVMVDEDKALTLAAYWCGVRVICETESNLPLFTYKRASTDESSGRSDDVSHAGSYYLYDLLKTAPNTDMGSMAFREGRTLHAVNFGNGFAEIEWDYTNPNRRQRVLALWPIHPNRVKPILAKNSGQAAAEFDQLYAQGYRYAVKNNDNSSTPLKPDEMLHIPGVLTEDGIWGKSHVQYHRETIGAGLAVREHGASYFGSGGIPTAVLYAPGMKDRESRRQFRQEWREMHGQPGANEIAILGPESKLEKLSFSNEDGQYLETSKFNVADIARILRIPTHFLMELMGPSGYNSLEQLSLEFVIYSLLPWLRRWEEQCNLKLILPQDRATYFVEHQIAGLLRGDFDARMRGYVQALQNGIMTINEVRRLENLNSIGPAGDVHYVQLNLTTADLMMNGQPPQMQGQQGRNGNGLTATAINFDLWTQEMAAKQREDTRRRLRRKKRERAALTVPKAIEDRRAIAPDAVKAVIADACCRALTKMAKDLERHANKITSCDEWFDAFLAEHGQKLSDALEPAAAIASTNGTALWAKLAADSRKILVAAFDADTPTAFRSRLADWPKTHAQAVADELSVKPMDVERPVSSPVAIVSRTVERGADKLIRRIIEERYGRQLSNG